VDKILIYLNSYMFNWCEKTPWRWFGQDRNMHGFWGIVFGKYV